MEFAELPIRRAEVSFPRHVPSQDIDGWQRIHFEGYKTTSKADNDYFLSILIRKGVMATFNCNLFLFLPISMKNESGGK